MNRCLNCFAECEANFPFCPYCGQPAILAPAEPIHLAPGTVLQDRYLLGIAIGAGGFGIVYKAYDLKLETVVAVKEFYVNRMMTRAAGTKNVIVSPKAQQEFEYRRKRFLAEARNMAKFGTHRSIPNVFEFFEENGTAYIVMELLEGMGLNAYMSENSGFADVDFSIFIANEIGTALKSLHEQKIVHRDVAPDNIYICSGKELKIKLMDLGAAKLQDSTDEVIDIILKPGYSPAEQYDKGKNIGPWSDIYALGATMYVMLTGIKPDESTNRKIKDEVVAPHLINPAISENLSNAIMKAMAIEKHMRFKNVDEFLSAVNGERKVTTLAKERKKRKRKRFVGIVAACLALCLISVGVIRTYSGKKAAEELQDAKITIWYPVVEGSNREKSITKMAEHFHDTYPNVEIEATAIPKQEYNERLNKAKEEGKLPTLFESSTVSSSVLENAIDLDNVINSEQFSNCLFLNQYDNYYSDKKKMPMGIEVPMAYIIKNGYTDLEYESDYFSAISDLGDNLSIHTDYEYVVKQNFNIEFSSTQDAFLMGENISPVLLSSTMAYNYIHDHQSIQTFGRHYAFYKADKIKCNFVYEWSIGKSDNENEIKAAERLLSWMLGNIYQDMLMISECNEGQIPLNRTTFFAKIGSKENPLVLTPIKDIYENFVFVGKE